MKLGIYSYVFYPESFLINELSFDLAESGHDVSVSTALPNYATGRFQQGYSMKGPYREHKFGVSIFRFPVFERRTGLVFLALNYFSNIICGCLNLLRMPKTDISFVFAVSPIFVVIPAIVLKRITGTPVVVWLQDLWPESFGAVAGFSEKHPLYKMLEVLVRWVYRHTDVMLIQSQAFHDNLSKYGFQGRVEYVPNWAPSPSPTGVQIPSWIEDLPKDVFLLTFAGNIGRAQSLDTLLSAAKELKSEPQFRVLFVGDGSELERLRRRVQQEDISNVLVVGRKPVSEMPALFQKSSALYVSLCADPLFAKVIPSKVQAYMASGKPLLASLNGEGARVVEEAGAGLTAPAENVETLVTRIRNMLHLDKKELEIMGQRGHDYYLRNFEKSRIMKKIAQILKETAR